MILNSTYYKNPQRTIVGLLNVVSTADTIILCDTSVGAVAIQLLEIPNDQWNTTYKLYIADKSSNASTNNITITAPLGFTINNQSSLVISTDGGAVLIRVASNTGYLGSLTSGGSGGSVSVINQQNPTIAPVTLTTSLDQLIVKGFQTTNVGNDVTLQNAFVSVTNAQIISLISGGTLIPNQIYQISNATFGITPPIAFNVFIKATSINSLDTYGSGKFFNADYNSNGDYSGVTGFVAQKGVWSSFAFPVVIGDVAIWNNLHWKNLTGLNGFNPPDVDLVNWQLLPYSATNGYIIEHDLIGYDVQTNRITWRKDNLLNYVEFFTDSGSGGTGFNSLNRFQWGNTQTTSNEVAGKSLFDNCNVKLQNTMSNNKLHNSNVILSQSNLATHFNSFGNNQFINSVRPMLIFGNDLTAYFYNNFWTNIVSGSCVLNAGAIIENNFFDSSTIDVVLSTATMSGNHVVSSTFDVSKSGGNFTNNIFALADINISNSTGTEEQNQVLYGQIDVTGNNAGIISSNNLQNGSFLQINIQAVSGSVFNNSIFGGARIIIGGTNSGNIRQNNIQNKSSIEINDQGVTGEISYNTMNNGSAILITDINSGLIGNGGIKGLGNDFTNGTALTLTSVQNSQEIYRNTFVSTEMTIINVDGSISQCQFTNSTIQLQSMNNNTLVGLILFTSVLGNTTYVLPQTFSTGEYIKGNGSIQANLDCSNPTIYDIPSQRLTIPNELRSFAGIYNLVNAGGISINQIVNMNSEIITKFKNNAGTTNFRVVAVGVAVANEIIGDATIPAIFGIVYRISGQDNVSFSRQNTFNAVEKLNIYV